MTFSLGRKIHRRGFVLHECSVLHRSPVPPRFTPVSNYLGVVIHANPLCDVGGGIVVTDSTCRAAVTPPDNPASWTHGACARHGVPDGETRVPNRVLGLGCPVKRCSGVGKGPGQTQHEGAPSNKRHASVPAAGDTPPDTPYSLGTPRLFARRTLSPPVRGLGRSLPAMATPHTLTGNQGRSGWPRCAM